MTFPRTAERCSFFEMNYVLVPDSHRGVPIEFLDYPDDPISMRTYPRGHYPSRESADRQCRSAPVASPWHNGSRT